MEKNKFNEEFLESFVDVATELLAYNKAKNNSPTPSLNDFSEVDEVEQNIVITTEEADQILSILKDLQNKLEGKEEKIDKLESELEEKQLLINRKNKEEKKTKKQSKNNSRCQEKNNFKSELIEHAKELDLVTVLIQSGSNCCDISGNVFRVYEDFIVLLGQNNCLVKILLDKIAAIKIINGQDKKQNKDSDCDETNVIEDTQERVDKEQEQNLKAI